MDRSDLSAFDVLVLAIAGSAAVLGGVVWGAPALAAVLSGHHFTGSFGEAIRASRRLPSHLQDPAEAWPVDTRAAIPGPWSYWTCELVVVLLVLALVIVAFWLFGRSRVGTIRRSPLGVNGRPRFAGRRDVAHLVVREPVPGRYILGRFRRRLLATEDRRAAGSSSNKRIGDRGAVALIGPSRSGKTAAAIASILEWSGPAVLSSVKTDLLGATHGWRESLGEVAIYDPTGTTQRVGAAWSPLRGAGTVIGAQRAARALCDAAPRGGVEGGIDFWLAQAEILLSGLLFVAKHVNCDMATVCEWVMTQDRPGEYGPGDVKAALDRLLSADDDGVVSGAVHASKALLAIWEMEERTRSSVYATAQTVVWPWADPGVAMSSRGNSVDLQWLLAGAHTLYLCSPIEDQQRLAPAFGGLLNDLIKQAYLVVAATGKPLDPPLLIVIDEAGNTPLRSLPEYASTLAGIGVLLVTIWQSVAQLESAYRKQADTILTNHLSKVFYAGLSDPASLRYVAQVLGDAEVESRSRGMGTDGGRRSVQLSTTRTPLAPPHTLRQMVPGDALLIHGTVAPVHLRTRPYFRDRDLLARSKLPPAAAVVTGTAGIEDKDGAP